MLYVPLPNSEERVLILEYFAKKCDLVGEALDTLRTMVQSKQGLSGADIENICREAILQRLRA